MSYKNHFQHHRELIYALEHNQSPFDQQYMEIATGRTADLQQNQMQQRSFSSQHQQQHGKMTNTAIVPDLVQQCSISIPRTTTSATSVSHAPFLTPLNINEPLSAQGNHRAAPYLNDPSGIRSATALSHGDRNFSASAHKQYLNQGQHHRLTPHNWVPYPQEANRQASFTISPVPEQHHNQFDQYQHGAQNISANTRGVNVSMNSQQYPPSTAANQYQLVQHHQQQQRGIPKQLQQRSNAVGVIQSNEKSVHSSNYGATSFYGELDDSQSQSMHNSAHQQQLFSQSVNMNNRQHQTSSISADMAASQDAQAYLAAQKQRHLLMSQQQQHQFQQYMEQQQRQRRPSNVAVPYADERTNMVLVKSHQPNQQQQWQQCSRVINLQGGESNQRPKHFIFPNSPIDNGNHEKGVQQLIQQQASAQVQISNMASTAGQFDQARLQASMKDDQFNNSRASTQFAPQISEYHKAPQGLCNSAALGPQKLIVYQDQQSQQQVNEEQKSNLRISLMLSEGDNYMGQQSLNDREYCSETSLTGPSHQTNAVNNQSTDVMQGRGNSLLNPVALNEMMQTRTPQRTWHRNPVGQMGSRDGNSSYTTDRRESLQEVSKKQQAAECLRQGGANNIMRLDLDQVINLDQNNMAIEQSIDNLMDNKDGQKFMDGDVNHRRDASPSLKSQQQLYMIGEAQGSCSSQSQQVQSKTVRSTPGPLNANRFSHHHTTNLLSDKSRQHETNNHVTPTLTLSQSHENKTMQTQQFLNTTMMQGPATINTPTLKDQIQGTSSLYRNRLVQDKSDQDIVFLTSEKTSQSAQSTMPLGFIQNDVRLQKLQAVNEAEKSEKATKAHYKKTQSQLQEIEASQAVNHLLNKSHHSDEFSKLLQMEIQQCVANNFEESKKLPELRAEPDEDFMGCNLGTHISTQRSNDSQNNQGVSNVVLMSPVMVGANNIGIKTMAQKETQFKSDQLQMTPQIPKNQQRKDLFDHSIEKVHDQLTPYPYDESCNEGYLPEDNNDSQGQATNSMESYTGRDSTSSSLSIYQRFPELPSQLREIVDLQNFRIRNVQVEVDTLKEQNTALKAQQAEQEYIKQQISELVSQNDLLKQMLTFQQGQHMSEIDQICCQIGPMMEALKLLTAADTVDFNQSQILADTSKAGEEMAVVNSNDISRIQRSLGGLMSKSLLQLKRSPGMHSSLSLTNSRFKLRALQSARSNMLENNIGQAPEQNSFNRQQQQQIIVTSARRVTQIVETTTSQQIIESEVGPEQLRSDFDEPLSIVNSESQERGPAPIATNRENKQERTKNYMIGAANHPSCSQQDIDTFTDDGNFVIRDEADIPESARQAATTLRTPIFNQKSKHQIDVRNHQRAMSWNHNIVRERQSAGNNNDLKVSQLINSPTDRSKRDASEAMSRKNPFTSNKWQSSLLPSQSSCAQSCNDNAIKRSESGLNLLLFSDRELASPLSPNETGITAIDIQVDDIKIITEAPKKTKIVANAKPPFQRIQSQQRIVAQAPVVTQIKIQNVNHRHHQPVKVESVFQKLMPKKGLTTVLPQGTLMSESEVIMFKPSSDTVTIDQMTYSRSGSFMNESNQPLSRKVPKLAFDNQQKERENRKITTQNGLSENSKQRRLSYLLGKSSQASVNKDSHFS